MTQYYVGVTIDPARETELPPLSYLCSFVDATSPQMAQELREPALRQEISPTSSIDLMILTRHQWIARVAQFNTMYPQGLYAVAEITNGQQRQPCRVQASSPQEALEDFFSLLPEGPMQKTPRIFQATLIPPVATPAPPSKPARREQTHREEKVDPLERILAHRFAEDE